MRQILSLSIWHRKIIGLGISIPFLTILGPFGTYSDLSLFQRAIFWTLLLCGIGVFMHLAISAALNWARARGYTQFTGICIGAMFAALPGMCVVMVLDYVMRPPGISMTLPQVSLLWLQVTLIGIAIGTFEFFQWPIADSSLGAPPFVKRLPKHVQEECVVISLSMQDHYVEASTDKGVFVVLMRLSDAMEEFTPGYGMQVHRSHWVACAHMVALRKSNNRYFLELSDGRDIPVSQTYVAEVERALSV